MTEFKVTHAASVRDDDLQTLRQRTIKKGGHLRRKVPFMGNFRVGVDVYS